jgi:hypothetical protein
VHSRSPHKETEPQEQYESVYSEIPQELSGDLFQHPGAWYLDCLSLIKPIL